MRTKKVIAEDRSKLQQTLAQFESDRAKNSARLAETNAAMEKHCVGAQAGELVASRAWDRAFRDSQEIKANLQRLDMASAKLHTQLNSLDKEWKEADNSEASQEYETEGEALIVAGDEAEKARKSWAAAQDKIKASLSKMERLASQYPIEPRHRNIQKHLRRAIEQSLDLGTVFLFKDTKNFYSRPIPEIFRGTLAGAATPEDAQVEKTGS